MYEYEEEILEIFLKMQGQLFDEPVAETLEDAIETVDLIASEHLEIVTKNPFELMTKVKNAGAIFLGEYASEPLGDYFAGPNHVLPTNGTARFFSPLGVDDFIKRSSIVYYSKEALEAVHEDIIRFAKAEQLTALGYGNCPICVAKTQYSLSDDAAKLGKPEHFTITVRDVTLSNGAGFVVVLTGNIMTMPGLPKAPSALKIDCDNDGNITGLF